MTPTEIRAAIRSLGLTQAEFGRLLEASERTVRSWCDDGPSGRRMPPLAVRELRRLMAAASQSSNGEKQ